MDLDYEYKVKLRRANGIEELNECAEEIKELDDLVNNIYSDYYIKYYKIQKYNQREKLMTKFIPLTIDYRHESANCAFEKTLKFSNYVKDSLKDFNLWSFKGLYTLYKIRKEYNK